MDHLDEGVIGMLSFFQRAKDAYVLLLAIDAHCHSPSAVPLLPADALDSTFVGDRNLAVLRVLHLGGGPEVLNPIVRKR